MKKIATVTGSAALALALLTGCGSNDKRDVEGVKSMDPDYIEVYNNTDGRPNVVLLCIRGVGFASASPRPRATTRPSCPSRSGTTSARRR